MHVRQSLVSSKFSAHVSQFVPSHWFRHVHSQLADTLDACPLHVFSVVHRAHAGYPVW